MEPTCHIDAFGNKSWRVKNKLHREDGPAAEYSNGTKFWYLDGKIHRIDGPAIEYADGDKTWKLIGNRYTFDDWKVEVRKYYETNEDYLLLLLKL
jgi:hypothetical protein